MSNFSLLAKFYDKNGLFFALPIWEINLHIFFLKI